MLIVAHAHLAKILEINDHPPRKMCPVQVYVKVYIDVMVHYVLALDQLILLLVFSFWILFYINIILGITRRAVNESGNCQDLYPRAT